MLHLPIYDLLFTQDTGNITLHSVSVRFQNSGVAVRTKTLSYRPVNLTRHALFFPCVRANSSRTAMSKNMTGSHHFLGQNVSVGLPPETNG